MQLACLSERKSLSPNIGERNPFLDGKLRQIFFDVFGYSTLCAFVLYPKSAEALQHLRRNLSTNVRCSTSSGCPLPTVFWRPLMLQRRRIILDCALVLTIQVFQRRAGGHLDWGNLCKGVLKSSTGFNQQCPPAPSTAGSRLATSATYSEGPRPFGRILCLGDFSLSGEPPRSGAALRISHSSISCSRAAAPIFHLRRRSEGRNIHPQQLRNPVHTRHSSRRA